MNRLLTQAAPLRSARNLRLWVLFLALIAVMQFSDPLGSVSIGDAALFWTARIGALALSLIFAEWLQTKPPLDSVTAPVWLRPAILAMIVAAIPMTAVEFMLESLVPQTDEFDDSSLRQQSALLALIGEYLTILSVVLPLNVLLWVLIDYRQTAGSRAVRRTVEHAQPAFLDKIGLAVENVLALEAQEHYVRIWTADGEELVYARLSDAVEQMPAELGTQVHRSWWVADASVTAAKRGDRRYLLTLSNGIEVPVSDMYRDRARKRGLLNRVRSARRP